MYPARFVLMVCIALLSGGCSYDGSVVDPTDPPFPMTAEQIATMVTSNQIFVRSVAGDGRVVIDCRCGPTVNSADIAPIVFKALIATEDIRFYSHKGFDPYSTSRALSSNVLNKLLRKEGNSQGGSTIEMQLCKNRILRKDKGITRKWQERSCAKAVAQALSKDDTLLAYLNSAYFGEGRGGEPTYGIEQAARTIFGKHASELLDFEAAVLIGMLQGPELNSPFKKPKNAKKRAQIVLGQLYKYDFISKRDYLNAKKARIKTGKLRHVKFEHRYFTDWVVKSIQGQSIRLEPGMHIPITLQAATQAQAEAAFKLALGKSGMEADQPAAFGTIRADGKVIAMMGGRDYKISQFNSFVYGQRPPASTFKSVVYAAGVESGLTLGEPVNDGIYKGEKWNPKLLENGRGMIPVAEAFALSRNIPAIRIAERVGYRKVAKLAKKMGIDEKLPINQNLALGGFDVSPLNMTSAFTTFTNQGLHVQPYGYHGVVDKYGAIVSWPKREGEGEVAISPKSAQLMQKLLRGVVADGTGNPAGAVKNAKGKTGTSDDNHDGWFIGFAEKTVTGVWLGSANSDADIPVNGKLASTVWAEIAKTY